MQRIVKDDFSALTQSRHFVAFLQAKAHFATVPHRKITVIMKSKIIYGSDSLLEISIPSKDTLKHVAQNVFTDGDFAYKYFDEGNEYLLNNEVAVLIKVRGLQYCQQIVVSADNVLVTKFINPKSIKDHEYFKNVNIKSIDNFLNTLIKMAKRNVYFDAKPKNIIYCKDGYFYPIDLMTAHYDDNAKEDDISFWLAPLLYKIMNVPGYSVDDLKKNINYAAEVYATILERLELINKNILRSCLKHDPHNINDTFLSSLSADSVGRKRLLACLARIRFEIAR